ncbi:MAG: DNA repair protein RecN (Recombination protein N) [Flavobacteriales bacterium]|jgi:DNA repair protein RecN (Recombination protein N)
MLTHLHISNFTLVERLELEPQSGLTVITGETGAGKSILLDALGLVLGERADADKVRQGCDKADIQASFDVSALTFVQKWLDENSLNISDSECLLRRVVTAEGRSRGFINGQAVTLHQLKALGDLLIDIHGQHEHQSLLKIATHRRLLDEFGQLKPLAKSVKREYYQWNSCKEQLAYLRNRNDELSARFQLLSYQVIELDQLNILDGELSALEDEQRQLAHQETFQSACGHLSELCNNDQDGISTRLNSVLRLLGELPTLSDSLQSAESLFKQALINIEEAQSDIDHQQQDGDLDPARLNFVEGRLSKIYDIARKHRVNPEELLGLHHALCSELKEIEGGDAQIESLEKDIKEKATRYKTLADKLSSKRKQAAKNLGARINETLKDLAMSHAQFYVALEDGSPEPNLNGNENIQFLISTAPGQSPKPLGKVASGGELSRISLAIQVATAKTSTTPTLVFDEVDVGIGGTTGDVVGRLLRELGSQGQIFCVTHLAQVASKTHHHWRVEKSISKTEVNSRIEALSDDDKVLEIARMMGGTTDSKQSLAHAREMLATL